MIRAFIAVELPTEVKARLADAQRGWKESQAGRAVRWTPDAQIHLTLRFLGDVAEDAVVPLSEALRRACKDAPGFELRVRGVGCFPDARRPRVFWAGVAGELAPLLHLRQRVVAETAPWGERDDREFHAHLTLGRMKDPTPREIGALREVLQSAAEVDFGSWPVRAVALMRSELLPQGARHSILATVPLTVL